MDNFQGEHEFTYASKDDNEAKSQRKREEDKWWLPTPKVPADGLSESTKKWLQFQKDAVHQVLKAALAINAQILMEMEVPESYTETLPKVLHFNTSNFSTKNSIFIEKKNLNLDEKRLNLGDKNRILIEKN